MSRAPNTLPLAIYAAATGLLEPLAPGLLRRRARRGKEDASRLNERLGRTVLARPEGPLVWLHGVSVGESLSLLPLIERMREDGPEVSLLVTSGTVTSAAVLAKRLPPGVIHQFAPVDAPRAVGRFLDHWRPDFGIFVESELWPNLISAAKARSVRLALLSARITEASTRGWARTPATARTLLRSFDLIMPQDDATEARLIRLGATCGRQLNLKLAGGPPPMDPDFELELAMAFGHHDVVVAASTHAGEESLVGRAYLAATAGRPKSVLIVAPRHPDRGPQVARELEELGFVVARRSVVDALTPRTTAYVVDTLGELGTLYRWAGVVVMGGSFVPGIGGHNPVEAATLRCPILTGPHVFNAQSIYDEMLSECAAIMATDEAALARHIKGLLTNPTIAYRVGDAAQEYARRKGGGALTMALHLIDKLMPA